jgi:dethiobiotin synthetase
MLFFIHMLLWVTLGMYLGSIGHTLFTVEYWIIVMLVIAIWLVALLVKL